MKLRDHLAGRKPEEKAHWTANVARYSMRANEDTKSTPEDLRDAVARSSGLSSQEARA